MRLAINEEAAEALGLAITILLYDYGCVYRGIPKPPEKFTEDDISLVYEYIHDEDLSWSVFRQAANSALLLEKMGTVKDLMESRGEQWAQKCKEKMEKDVEEDDSILYAFIVGEATFAEWLCSELNLQELNQVLYKIFDCDTDALLCSIYARNHLDR